MTQENNLQAILSDYQNNIDKNNELEQEILKHIPKTESFRPYSSKGYGASRMLDINRTHLTVSLVNTLDVRDIIEISVSLEELINLDPIHTIDTFYALINYEWVKVDEITKDYVVVIDEEGFTNIYDKDKVMLKDSKDRILTILPEGERTSY